MASILELEETELEVQERIEKHQVEEGSRRAALESRREAERDIIGQIKSLQEDDSRALQIAEIDQVMSRLTGEQQALEDRVRKCLQAIQRKEAAIGTKEGDVQKERESLKKAIGDLKREAATCGVDLSRADAMSESEAKRRLQELNARRDANLRRRGYDPGEAAAAKAAYEQAYARYEEAAEQARIIRRTATESSRAGVARRKDMRSKFLAISRNIVEEFRGEMRRSGHSGEIRFVYGRELAER